ncbi:ydjO [Escherichia coli]|nr:ydjO [Escherichia coli]
MMSLWDALRMNMMISYQELVRTFLSKTIINHSSRRLWERHQWLLTMPEFPVAKIPHPQRVTGIEC